MQYNDPGNPLVVSQVPDDPYQSYTCESFFFLFFVDSLSFALITFYHALSNQSVPGTEDAKAPRHGTASEICNRLRAILCPALPMNNLRIASKRRPPTIPLVRPVESTIQSSTGGGRSRRGPNRPQEADQAKPRRRYGCERRTGNLPRPLECLAASRTKWTR